jgi:dihydrofolate reductase
LTRILTDFECDTIFPLSSDALAAEYEKKSHEELCKWTGEEELDEFQEENGVKYQFEMWERR